MFCLLVCQYLSCWYCCRRVLVVLVVGLCLTMVPRATTVSVSIGSFRLNSAWTSGQSMFGLIPPVCWSGPPIASGLPLFFTYTALMVSTHRDTYVLPSSFTVYFPSCSCVVPVSGAFLDHRRRNGQRHSTAQVCLTFDLYHHVFGRQICLHRLVFCVQGCVGGPSRLVCVTERDGSVGGAGGLWLCAGSNVRFGASCWLP